MLSLALKPRWIAGFHLAILLASIFVALSAWQVDRAQHRDRVISDQDLEQTQQLTEALQPQGEFSGLLAEQRVELSGHYLPEDQALVPGRTLDGAEGWWVVTMFVPDGAELPPAEGIAGGYQLDPDGEIAIPVVRGWAPEIETARSSTARTGEATIIGRLGPTEPPMSGRGLADDEIGSVSTAELVNLFDLYSYSGIVFPEEENGPGASWAVDDLRGFPPPQTAEEGGFNWQSAVYAVEWLVFAAFALHIWWRLLRDEYERQREGVERTQEIEYTVVKEAGEKSIHG